VTPNSVFSDFEDTDLEEDDYGDDLGLAHSNATEAVEIDEPVSDHTPVPTDSDGGSLGSKVSSTKSGLCSGRVYEQLLWDDMDDHSVSFDDSENLIMPLCSQEADWDYAGEFILDESGSEATDACEEEVVSDCDSDSDGSMLGLVGEADLGNNGGTYTSFKDYGLGLEDDTEMDF
jgi:hypothetical protein